MWMDFFLLFFRLEERMNGFGFGNQVKYDSISRFASTRTQFYCDIYFAWCRNLGSQNEKRQNLIFTLISPFTYAHFPVIEIEAQTYLNINFIFRIARKKWGKKRKKVGEKTEKNGKNWYYFISFCSICANIRFGKASLLLYYYPSWQPTISRFYFSKSWNHSTVHGARCTVKIIIKLSDIYTQR